MYNTPQINLTLATDQPKIMALSAYFFQWFPHEQDQKLYRWFLSHGNRHFHGLGATQGKGLDIDFLEK